MATDPSPPLDLDAALSQAEAAQAAADLPAGLAAAEAAWRLSDGADADRRLRAGRLVMHFRYRSGLLGPLVDAGMVVLPLMRRSGLPPAELFDTLRLVVLGAADVGRFEEAMALGHEAHRLADEAGDRPRLSLALNALGCVYERLGDPWHAERLLLDALAIARAAGDARASFVALNNLTATLVGAHYLLQGQADDDEVQRTARRALPHALQAIELAQSMGDPFFIAFVRGNLGELRVQLGQLDEARVDLDAAMALSRQGGFEAQTWRIACSQAELLLALGEPARAWQLLLPVQQAASQADVRTTHLRLHHTLWRAARAQGLDKQALHHLEQAMALERWRMLAQSRGHSQVFVTQVEAEQVRLEARRAGERATQAEVNARVDPLTGLGNRRELDLRWGPLVQRHREAMSPLALAMIDLDHFKQVNDRFGHGVGDAVLVALAKLLRDNLRLDDLIVRIGGEEVLLVLPDTDAARAIEVCERLRQCVLAHGWELLAPGLQVQLSIGVAVSPPYDLRGLIDRADAALYAAKQGGRNRVQPSWTNPGEPT